MVAHCRLRQLRGAAVELGERPAKLLADGSRRDPRRRRRAEGVARVESPFTADFREQEASPLRLWESGRRGLAVDVDVERAVGRVLQAGGFDPGQALLGRRLTAFAPRAAGELGTGLGRVARGQ